MKVITADDFLEVLNHLETMDPEEELEPLIDRFGEEQPFLAAYLDEMGGEDLNDDEHEVLFFFGVALWHAVEKYAEEPIAEITEAHLDNIQEKNEALLEQLSTEQGDISIDALTASIAEHPQHELLVELFDVIKEEEAEFIRPKNVGEILFFLKITMDCLVHS
ncbi:MAG: hypothetical protein NWR72_13240 [Bacteroidia bacterium]|nr:hypothetical protein [Bacteroidia bacterium]